MARLLGGSGGGGSGTVTTDGVTIQGDGSVGNPIAIKNAETDGVTLQGQGTIASNLALKAVQTNAGLTGAGTVGSPLGAAPTTYWQPWFGRGSLSSQTITANTLYLSAMPVNWPVTFSHIGYAVNTADNSGNLYDIGVYNAAGTLLVHLGATAGTTFCPTTGNKSVAVSSTTLQPGVYYFAVTGNASTLSMNNCDTSHFFASISFGASSGGALPNSITPQSFSGANDGIRSPIIFLLA